MKCKSWSWLVSAMALVLAVAIGASAQGSIQLSGWINDYTPATVTLPPNSLGPWEIRGEWTLKVKGESGKADFSAALNMVRSDYWVVQNNNPDDPEARVPHTHHISLVDGDVTPLTNGFRVTGTAAITGNGGPAKFGLMSPLQIDVTGGSIITYSNINLTFGDPAAEHFGTEPLSGIVRAKMDSHEGMTVRPTAWVAPSGASVGEVECAGHAEKQAPVETQGLSTRAEALGRDDRLWGRMVKE